MELTIYTDGAARGNPGPAGAGAVIQVQNSKFKVQSWRVKKFLGITTNNRAEYQALILGLEEVGELIKYGVIARRQSRHLEIDKIICYSDSQLLVRQLRREYKVKDADLGKLFVKIYNLSQELPPLEYYHIRREKNKEADRLANKAIDQAQK